MVRLERDGSRHLPDWHLDVRLEELGKVAFIFGGQVDDDHEGEVGILGDVLEEFLKRGKPACRGPNADDGKRTSFFGWGLFGSCRTFAVLISLIRWWRGALNRRKDFVLFGFLFSHLGEPRGKVELEAM